MGNQKADRGLAIVCAKGSAVQTSVGCPHASHGNGTNIEGTGVSLAVYWVEFQKYLVI